LSALKNIERWGALLNLDFSDEIINWA